MLEAWRAKRGLQSLVNSWTEYHTMVADSLRTEQVTWDKQEPFLALKGKIATQLQLLADAAPPEWAAEARREIGEITDLLKAHVNLRERTTGVEWDPVEFDRVWHKHYIFLHRLKGMPLRVPEAKRADRAAPRPKRAEVPTGIRPSKLRRPVNLAGPIRFVTGLGLFAMIVYMAAAGLGIHRSPETGKLTAQMPATFELALVNVLDALQALWGVVTTGFAPWLRDFWPIGLAIIVLTAVGFWVVNRRFQLTSPR